MEASHPITRVLTRSALLMGVLVVAMLSPAATFADDGQVLATGSNVAGNVFISGGHARVNFNNLGDCPNGQPAGSCWMEVQFRWHCAEPWCFGFSSSGWYTVPAGQDFYTHPGCADGSNDWQVYVRQRNFLPTANKIQIRGNFETVIGGSVMIPKYLGNLTLNTGYKGEVLISTVTGANVISSPGLMAESLTIAGPPSC